jgi:hypothetical protein
MNLEGERLKGCIPIICNPGDVVICNRQLIHGSFPNCGYERRVTVNFGFHKRSSVLGVKGGGIHSASQIFNSDVIERRSRVLGYAIEARKERFPDEKSYIYKPFIESNKVFQWTENSLKDLKDYNLDDLSI